MGLFDFVTSAFTAPGTNAREGQERQQGNAAGYASKLLPGEYDYTQKQQDFRNSQWPTATGAVKGLGQFTTQAGRNQKADAYTNWAQAQAAQAASRAPAQFAGNPSLSNAWSAGQANNANSAAADYGAQINSPDAMQNAYTAYLKGLGSLSPDYSGIGNLTNIIYKRPAVNVGQGLGGFIGQLASQYASAQTGGLLGGGGGGGMSVPNSPGAGMPTDFGNNYNPMTPFTSW